MNNQVIKHTNIIYMPHISPLGGIETYVYEMVKKYKDLDIAVVSKKCDKLQAARIKKYCKLYIHTNQKIECKVAIINYDISIIDYINKDAKIYETIHGDYSNPIYGGKTVPTHDRITAYIAITDYLQGKMKELLNTDNVIMSYNPLTIEETDPIVIVTASRLHANKGKNIMNMFAKEMDRQGINYVWYVITNDIGGIDSPNVIFINNRLDIDKWTAKATYGALFSKSEACSYFINEMLYRNIPMLVTPLPYLKEIGVEDGKNAYIVDFDGSNIKEVVSKIKNVPKFKFEKLKDKYSEIFVESKSTYQNDLNTYFLVEATNNFSLEDFYRIRNIKRKNSYNNKEGFLYTGDTFECDKLLFEYLSGENDTKKQVVKIIKK